MTQPTQSYTDSDVELVASTFVTEAKKNPVDSATPRWMGQTRMLLGPTEHDIARAVLDALAAAGRLLPEGTATRAEWATRLVWDSGQVEDHGPSTFESATRRVDYHRQKKAAIPEWRATAELVSRKVHTTPWASAEAKP